MNIINRESEKIFQRDKNKVKNKKKKSQLLKLESI